MNVYRFGFVKKIISVVFS